MTLALLDRQSAVTSRQNEAWSAICADFLSEHAEDPEPECRIAGFFCAAIDRKQAVARDYVEEREWVCDRHEFEQRLTDLILDVDPLGQVMRDAAYEALVAVKMAREKEAV